MTSAGPDNGPRPRSIIAINARLLYACFLGGVAWVLWPSTAKDWQFGLFAIFCGLSAFALAIRGFCDIWHYIRRDIGVGRFKRGGRNPHSDRLAEDDVLRKAGMIE